MGKIKKRLVKSPAREKQGDSKPPKIEWPSDAEYISFFNNCVIAKGHLAEIDRIIDRKILPGRGRYEQVALGASSHISISDTSPFRILAPGNLNRQPAGQGRFYVPDLLRNVEEREPASFELVTQLQTTYKPFHIGEGQDVGSFRLTANTGRMVPWYVVAVIHNMEGGCNFNVHLHNGDPLTGFTKHFPPGHPWVGHAPPFGWEESAVDALVTVRHFDEVPHWNLPTVLRVIENYNGAAYRLSHRYTPYLWSYSNLFVKGKFVADHKFDPNAGSGQAGAGVVLKRMEERDLIYIPRW